jgi:ADP-ribose 1''-phosphate phosphatase
MKNISIVKGDLFKAPSGSVLVHACNAQGVWGAGIAKMCAQKFPRAREEYTKLCKEKGTDLLGTCILIDVGEFKIACLITSNGFGARRDSPDVILENTRRAVADLLAKTTVADSIHMCKINSGLFAVPWYRTEALLDHFNRPMTVWEFP